MPRYEYKIVEIRLKGWGLFRSKQMEGFEETLNREGAQGWRYVDSALQTGAYGEAGSVKLVFERTTGDQ